MLSNIDAGRAGFSLRPTCRRAASLGLIAAVAAAIGAPVAAQEGGPAVSSPDAGPATKVALSLDEAVRRATGESEEIRLARSSIDLANAQVASARAAALPQISASVGYSRTFESSFSGGVEISIPDSLRFEPDETAPLADRVTYLEDRVPTAALGGLAQSFGSLPFGQEHAYTAQIQASQMLYSGGRLGAARRIASSFERAARYNLDEDRAEIEFQVRTAYYQALLAQELEAIAEAALLQAEDFLAQERARLSAGSTSDLDVLRAEVSRDNLRPQLVEAANAAELSQLNLKRLVDVPLSDGLKLTTPLEAPERAALADSGQRDIAGRRAAVLAATEQVDIRAQQRSAARGNFLPTVSVGVSYGRQLFPSGSLKFDGDWRTDWTANLSVSIPIFNGGQSWSDMRVATIELDQSRLQLAQLKETVQLQYEQARGERLRALEAIDARRTTVGAAQRVYDLTVLRYDRGLATQLEVSQSRLELLQARTNLAQAIGDYHIADASVARAAVVAR